MRTRGKNTVENLPNHQLHKSNSKDRYNDDRFNDKESMNESVHSDYQGRLKKLLDTIQEQRQSMPMFSLIPSSLQVYCSVTRIMSDPKNAIPEEKLTEILEATARVIKGPAAIGNKAYRSEVDNYHKLSTNIRKYSLANILVASMMCLIGAVLMVTSGMITAATLGWMTPVGVLGGMLGISIIVGGVSAGLSGGSGVGFLMSSGIFFHKMIQKNPLRKALEDVESSVREIYSFRK